MIKDKKNSGRFTLKDIRRLLTRSNITDIQDAIRARVSLDIIRSLLQNEKDTSILNHFLLNKQVLNPSKLISKDTSYTEVLKSKFPVVGKYLTDMTTLRDICIENYDDDPEYYKEVFEFLLELELEQKNPQKNLAELVVYLVDYTILNPKSNHGFLDAMEKHKDKINFNQTVFIPYRTGTNNNDSREPSVNSSNSQTLSPDRVVELYRHSIQQEQQKRQNQGETVTLEEFLSVVKTSENPKIAAFAEAIMPSKNVDGPNLTQHLTPPRECPQR